MKIRLHNTGANLEDKSLPTLQLNFDLPSFEQAQPLQAVIGSLVAGTQKINKCTNPLNSDIHNSSILGIGNHQGL